MENWKKAFDCIPHDLHIAKLHTYGLSEDAVTFLYSYLKLRKQFVKINDTEGFFKYSIWYTVRLHIRSNFILFSRAASYCRNVASLSFFLKVLLC